MPRSWNKQNKKQNKNAFYHFIFLSQYAYIIGLFLVLRVKKGFDKMRGEAMIATVTAAPETCALYLGSEMWGTGASEGTKLEVGRVDESF